jgi:1,4-dihydroxy-2-naphthoate octaprenyltransferase
LTSLSFISGILLIKDLLEQTTGQFIFFLSAGVLAILAALGYTLGRKPYGYAGLGDLFVMIFFGLVGVAGSYFLHAGRMPLSYLLPAAGTGFFSVAVLNINNIRDIESDRQAGKFSIPVRIGMQKAVTYHWTLLWSGLTSTIIFSLINYRGISQFLFLLAVPLLVQNGLEVSRKAGSDALDGCLKKMALTTLLFVLTFGIGLLLVN